MSVPSFHNPSTAGAGSLRPELGTATTGNTIRPFSINVPEEVLVDLRRRVGRHGGSIGRLSPIKSQGVPLAKIQERQTHTKEKDHEG